ncbi:NAD(+) synthase [Aminipila luticellarii]|uniref:Glutamine-dependent NAD(+) synthetase n=1 Tax=Aminipila luticellarii TaxID=2507160 RepID=A0A410PSV4_9FIRM|nr:NAD(+) synthase [Aminipila luticellarii]QAT41948.1 NAD(+) synthase [Aminipila luticellarii]
MTNMGFVRVASVSPKIKVANTQYNVDQILRYIGQAADEKIKAGFVLFPELCVTGYTCADLFYQPHLYEENLKGLERIVKASKGLSLVIIVGFYYRVYGNLYNCAALIQNGRIRGIVPKMFIPDYKEFYEARWFAPGSQIVKDLKSVRIFEEEVPFGNLIFRDEKAGFGVGIEICEDLWMPVTPGTHLALNGADIIFNASASNETVGKSQYRKSLVLSESAKNNCGYVYASAGVNESTTDLVFSGHTMIAENGTMVAEGDRFQREGNMLTGDLDFQRIHFERSHGQTFSNSAAAYADRNAYVTVELEPVQLVEPGMQIRRTYEKNPFVPSDPAVVHESCREIFNIQTAGLAKRMEHSHAKKSVVGISGGLDSTLALLVTAKTHRLLGRPASDIVAVTMPGFGTTGKTYNNALTIMKLLGAEVREIPIGEAVLKHFEDIGQDKEVHDLTYENCQARERTQILMDIANKEGGLVVGTGDLSELALGWCTYNGDHMSMYGVNAGIPKTLVRFVVQWVMENLLSGDSEDRAFSRDNPLLKKTLQDILDTPISPELLPPDENGNIAQKTEDSVGPYILHDFFIFYTLRHGMPPEKLLYVAKQAFADEYDEEFIKKWLITFYRRFFGQQFKRSCVPDGPKVGSVSLSPRGDWRMPSDADAAMWLAELE